MTSRESTTMHILWGQLSTTCSTAIEVTQWAAPGCSRPQPAMDSTWRQRRQIQLTHRPTPLYGTVPLSATCMLLMRATNHKCSQWDANAGPSEH